MSLIFSPPFPFVFRRSFSTNLALKLAGDRVAMKSATREVITCEDAIYARINLPGVEEKDLKVEINEQTKKTLPKFLESTILTENTPNINRIKLFSGSANPILSQEIASNLGLELGKVKRKRFAGGEIYFQLEESVRGCDVYLLQPTCPPVNDNLMELKIMIETCWSSSAKTITAVITYFGYARADRRVHSREPITARIAARDIARANHVLVCDIHSAQSIGYFDIHVDHVQCEPVILDYLASKGVDSSNMVVVSPDVGGVARARSFAKKLGDAPLAIVDKRRQAHNIADVMNLIGDVKGKIAILVDDMIDTAGTIAKGAELLHKEGAREVYACCTHAVFSPPAIESSGMFQEVIVTNTIPVADENYFPQLTVLSTATLLAETIWRLHNECSIIVGLVHEAMNVLTNIPSDDVLSPEYSLRAGLFGSCCFLGDVILGEKIAKEMII